MGKTTRWLKALFGLRSACRDPNPSKNPHTAGFGGSGRDPGTGFCHNPATIPPNITPEEAAWLRSFYLEGKDEVEEEAERSKHAIAVAAATAAAADAAVAAAHAAVEVVRLTSRGRNHTNNNNNSKKLFASGDGLDDVVSWAAVRIQTNFRAYLARKALRALKGLVKIQALVRGYLVRRQATATLHGMQALIRAQATVRSKRASVGLSRGPSSQPEPDSLNWACPSISASFEARTLNPPIDHDNDTPKVVEVDIGQAGSRSARRGPGSRTCFSELGEDPSSYQILPPQFQYDFQSHPQFAPARISVPNHHHHPHCCHHFHESEECRSTTAQTTPRFSGPDPMGPIPPLTPTRAGPGPGPGPGIFHGGWGRQEVYYRYYPNYMAKTMSFKAKVRSQSAPKQRPESSNGNNSSGTTSSGSGKKRMSLSEMMEGRTSLSGVRMQRSCSQVQEAINFKNAVMGRLGRSPL